MLVMGILPRFVITVGLKSDEEIGKLVGIVPAMHGQFRSFWMDVSDTLIYLVGGTLISVGYIIQILSIGYDENPCVIE
jgi:hypothetical protein